MNSDTISLLVKLYNKVSGVPIFDLKAYIEPTHAINQSTVWKILTDVFVNFFFMILNLTVGFISLVLRFFENFDLYDTYKRAVYDTSRMIWQGLSGSGNYNHSILYLVIAISAFVIFIGYTFSRGDVGKRLLHLFAVILLGLGYFGTMHNTSGGLYILDTVHNVANSASDSISNISITNPQNKKAKISTTVSVADNYIARTSYAAYLYVNTGRLDGKYFNNQTGKAEDFDDSKILGQMVDGKFEKVDVKQRDKEDGDLDYLGHGGDEAEERNRWVSAVSDYIFIKSLYVFLKIIEAVVLGLPLLLIQLISFVAQLLIIFLMIAFPFALIVSFIPRLQDTIFNVMKLMLGSAFFPVLTGFLTLMVFYIEAIINVFVSAGFDGLSENDLNGFTEWRPVFELAISTVLQAVVFIAIWKNKEKVLTYILGQNQARSLSRLVDGTVNAPSALFTGAKSIYDKASDVATAGLVVAGAGTGLALTAKDGIDKAMNMGGQTYLGVNPNALEGEVLDGSLGEQNYLENEPTETLLLSDGLVNAEDEFVETPDYDGYYQGIVEDDSSRSNVSIEDFEDELNTYDSVGYSGEENTDVTNNAYHQNQSVETNDFTNLDNQTINEKVEVPSVTSELPKDFKTYQKQRKLEDELSQYQSVGDLGKLQGTKESAFKRGLSKTTTKSRQYRMNINRISNLERKLERMRGM